MMLRLFTPLALVLPAPALACSVVNEYRVPTNLELAQSAELILLGRVTGEQQSADDDGPQSRAILVEPVAALKGSLPARPIALPGMMLATGRAEKFGMLSNPYDFGMAHPASYIGGCVRYIFPQGTTALFFLKRGDDGTGWIPAGGPFSRWAEDALSDDAPWPRLARLYARAAAMPEAERKALLETERTALAARTGDVVARLMAADIARQLLGPNAAWNQYMRNASEEDDVSEAAAEAGAAAEAAAEEVEAAAKAADAEPMKIKAAS